MGENVPRYILSPHRWLPALLSRLQGPLCSINYVLSSPVRRLSMTRARVPTNLTGNRAYGGSVNFNASLTDAGVQVYLWTSKLWWTLFEKHIQEDGRHLRRWGSETVLVALRRLYHDLHAQFRLDVSSGLYISRRFCHSFRSRSIRSRIRASIRFTAWLCRQRCAPRLSPSDVASADMEDKPDSESEWKSALNTPNPSMKHFPNSVARLGREGGSMPLVRCSCKIDRRSGV